MPLGSHMLNELFFIELSKFKVPLKVDTDHTVK